MLHFSNIKINIRNSMTTLSIILSEKMAKESQVIAKNLGIPRTQFIRQAIMHELEHFRMKSEQEAMAKCFVRMKKNSAYLTESEEIMGDLNVCLPVEKDQWWEK